jgi:hypothetical protein
VEFYEPIAMGALAAQNGSVHIELRSTTGVKLDANNRPANESSQTSVEMETVNQAWTAKSAKVLNNNRFVVVDFGGTSVAQALAYAKENANGLFLHISDNNTATNPIWGYNGEHTNLAGLLTDFAKTNEFTDAELIASPIFRKFDNPLFHQTNLIAIAQTELNKVMGDGIPATSFAAGRNPISGSCVAGNILMSPDDTSPWPRIVDDQRKWYHSDFCKIAFFYVHPIFKKIKEGDSQ